ncbi:DUF397 domain-containing protein [Streptomyces sp. NPDC057245]|uniref:DUF397 domain-containing protein n=1 Tax=Streptomyces TaxID=1883 RepID=UPI001C1E5F93|nr:DUF397 domain-containing protein [Streptomyces sp. A108]MBU6535138.1 DUF397 domain-containing protein [Streptomyces sp. A108]
MSTSDLAWFKSTYSSGGDGDCVEVAVSGQPAVVAAVHVRDSKQKRGPQLALSPTAWHDFVSYAVRD